MSLGVSKLRATAHPIRLRMLSLLTGAAMSAAELARELDISHANASYHLRALAAAGVVEEAGEETIRGGVAKRYRYRHTVEKKTAQEVQEDLEGKYLVWLTVAHELIRRAENEVWGNSMLCDAELWVEPEVWDRALQLAREASTVLHENAKPPRTEGTIHVNATMGLFRMANENGAER